MFWLAQLDPAVSGTAGPGAGMLSLLALSPPFLRPPLGLPVPSAPPPLHPWEGHVLRQPLSEGGKMATSSVSPAQRGHYFPHYICQSLGPGSQQPQMGYEPSLDLPLCLLRPRPGPRALSGDDQ